MQANGRADTFFEQIFPTYTETAAQFGRFLRECGEARPSGLPGTCPLRHRGDPISTAASSSAAVHYNIEAILDGVDAAARAQIVVVLTREDLDRATRAKRDRVPRVPPRRLLRGRLEQAPPPPPAGTKLHPSVT